jgi:endoglucanase
MSGKHAAFARRSPRTVLVAELALAILAASVPTAVLASTSSSAATPATPRAAWSANKLVGSQASFDTGSGGWTTPTNGARVNKTVIPAQTGTGSLAVSNGGQPGPALMAMSGSTTATGTRATAGMRYMGWTSVRAATTGRAASAIIAFADSQGRRLDQAQGQPLTDNSSSWQQLYPAVAIAPPNTAYAVLEVVFDGAGSMETHYLDNALLKSAPGGSARVAGPLRTVGNQIVDANNHAVIFRGANRTGLEGLGGGGPTLDDMSHAKTWGMNFIRVTLGEQLWMPSTCYYDPTYVSQVDAAVNTITSLGMVAMLNLHYNTITQCGHFGQQPMADAPNALTFWQQVASRYKNNPLVAFDLYNEPFNLTEEIWAHGGAVTWHNTTFQAAGMQQMYDAVRGTGAQNLVFVSGNHWGNWFPKIPLTGFNIVYAAHAYTCSQDLPPDCWNTDPYNPAQYLSMWDKPSQTYPVMVTEFGWPDGGADGRYVHNVIRYAETRGWGWSVFTWGNATYGPFDLLASAGPGKNYEPKPGGMALLAALPGN